MEKICLFVLRKLNYDIIYSLSLGYRYLIIRFLRFSLNEPKFVLILETGVETAQTTN
jgi:hypothetical protein